MDMNIVMATSDLYSQPAVVTVYSLLMNNTGAESLKIFYISNEITEPHKQRLRDIACEFGRKIVFLTMPDKLYNNSGLMRTHSIVYSYCYFQDILPDNVDRMLLLESDTIVLGDLSEMYETDLGDCLVAACDDLQSKYCKQRVGIAPDSPYFNAGVMLFDLKRLRQEGFSTKITKIIQSGRAKYLYEVQDELNYALEGRVKIMPPRFNCTTAVELFSYDDMRRYRWPSTCCTREDFDNARQDPVVVHFTKNQIIQSRPWVEGCTHSCNERYLAIRRNTSVAQEPLWPAKWGTVNRIVHFIYTKISPGLLARMLGVIHAFLYPKFLYKYILK